MKKIIIFATTLFVGATMFAQTFVDTVPHLRNVVLEEFTGINCGYCPDAHRIAADMAANNPGRVFPIAIHAGGYAAAYTTPQGDTLLKNWISEVSGYPCGMVNRTRFASKTILNRGDWNSKVNSILQQNSCVNIAARCTIDCATRDLTVEVEVYYTGASTANINFLNVAVLQNNILGRQSGMELNPDQVVGVQYRHMHMFRKFMSASTWGDTIKNTSRGSFFTKTYTCQLPATISSTTVVPRDISIVAFVAENKNNIITGCEPSMHYLNGTPYLSAFKNTNSYNSCNVEYNTYVTLTNLSTDTISSAEIMYGKDGSVTNSLIRNNLSIAPGTRDTIHLPVIGGSGYLSGREYTLKAYLLSFNGDTVSSDQQSLKVSKTKVNAQGNLTLTINTDAYGSETTWKFRKIDGTVVASGGPYNNLTSVGTTEHIENITVPGNGCYYIEVEDAAGDGINSTDYGQGNFKIVDATGNTVVSNNGQFGSVARYFMNMTGFQGIDESSEPEFAIFPNPAKDIVTVNSDSEIHQIDVIDLQGKVLSSYASNTVSVADLAQGTYLLRIITDNGASIRKIVKE